MRYTIKVMTSYRVICAEEEDTARKKSYMGCNFRT